MIRTRKAISTLIATVLLVLITLAAVGIVVGAVMPLIQGTIDKGRLCSEAGITVNKDYTYYNATSTVLSLVLAKGPNQVAINKIQIKVRDITGASKLIENSTVPAINSEGVYRINMSANGLGQPIAVGIAPVIKQGNSEFACEVVEVSL